MTLEAALEEITLDTLYEHVYAAHTAHRPSAHQHLGYVDKSADCIDVWLPRSGIDLAVQQLLLALSSATQPSSTGFICWQAAQHVADWAAACPHGFLAALLTRNSVVLEMGSGAAAVLALVLGPAVRHYVALDQAHVLKLMKHNFRTNAVLPRWSSGTCDAAAGPMPRRVGAAPWSTVDFVALDWECSAPGMRRFVEVTGRRCPDVILACDTVYNSYLIPPFLACMRLAMAPETVAVVAMQLRDETITEEFLEHALRERLRVFRVRDECLTPELIEGFAVYCFRT